MEMLITPDWLRNKNKTEPELEVEAGFPVEHLSNLAMFLPPDVVDDASPNKERVQELHHAFGLFVRQLRLRENLTVESLAEKARVNPIHIESIECDITFRTPPRTVVNLARVFDIPASKMMVISGVADNYDDPITEEVLKFAAKSNGVSSLNQQEQEILSAFVKIVVEA
jgi:transcriptional regulator with XRE-family HTH domain